MKRLGNTCIECGSSIVNKVEEQASRQFKFVRTEFACGATLETFQTTNNNVARAIQNGCSATE